MSEEIEALKARVAELERTVGIRRDDEPAAAPAQDPPPPAEDGDGLAGDAANDG